MALEDYIAESGGRMVRSIGDQFLAGRKEARQARMDEEKLKDMAFNREQAKVKAEQDAKIHELAIRDYEQKYQKAVADGKLKEWEQAQKILDQRIDAASALKTTAEKREYLKMHKGEIFEAGNDEEDKAFDKMMKSDDRTFETYLNYAVKSRQMIRKREHEMARRSYGGSTAAERANLQLLELWHATNGAQGISPEEYNRRVDMLGATKSGARLTAGQEATKKRAEDKAVVALRKEYDEAKEPFRFASDAIEGAFAALDSGDTALADKILTQFVAQIGDPKTRAYQMFKEYNSAYGNIAERIGRSIERFITGARTPEEREDIKHILTKFREEYVAPGMQRTKTKYRALSRKKGHDEWQAVPPDSPEEIYNSPLLSKEDKKTLLNTFFPEWVKENFGTKK